MDKLNCFDNDFERGHLDRRGSLFHHRLLGHPALSLENLAKVIPALPPAQVFHSSGLLDNSDNFDRAHLEHQAELGLEETLERLRHTDAYIMVRQPETADSFKPLLQELKADVQSLVREAGISGGIDEAMLYLFIASPNSVTPFHIDRYSTFLLQFRGSKQVTVYPPWDPRVVSDEDTEHFFAQTGRRPAWRPEVQSLGTRFEFSPGQALHIPFVAGHHVRNGSDDVSISLSIIFNTEQTRSLMRALALNHQCRKWMKRIGMAPRRVALDADGVALKSQLWGTAARVARRLR
ncbi:cupin-like domain-containing protein [Pseudoxanthomonas dokdonensis]|uniref:JmjC domain-containing protein n=1 Tax=Pseudoxanthomonas dokdonensis TaxID=344882 RepID=A0A0R0CLP3_9GAMM|nr:cupin-like domain-containing protein [Pseudoxanthomonas dokdonensis]KRG70953.1 hypothetical protein ABB29_03735 [Pseudoxanthomonas dokdonensis]